jgi:hypothetical protein
VVVNGVGVVTILNTTAAPHALVQDQTVTAPTSGQSFARFYVQLSNASQSPVSVVYATANNTAVAGVDYTAVTGVLSFSPGDTVESVLVPIAPHARFQNPRTFFFRLSNPSNVTLDNTFATGTILSTVAEPTLTVGDVAVTAPIGPSARQVGGGATAVFTVTLSAPSGEVTTVDYATADGSAVAGIDYLPVSGTLVFSPGVTKQTVSVVIPAQSAYAGPNPLQFVLTLSNPVNAVLGSSQAVASITRQASPPVVSVGDATVKEGDFSIATAWFPVVLNGPSDVSATVEYTTADLTAVAGRDYFASTGSVTFVPGETVKYIGVSVPDNLRIDPTLQFLVVLSSPVNASIGRGVGVGSIIDSDALVVTNTADGGPGSLRRAMLRANLMTGADTITFAIPGPGPFTINVHSALPTVTGPVTIDATTQPGYAGSPVVQINGANAGAGVSGLVITAGGSTVKGLAINRFGGSGVLLLGRGGNTIQGDWIGLDLTGQVNLGNRLYGVDVENSRNNLIGGPGLAGRDVVSGNNLGGVHLAGPGASGNILTNDFIGTNSTGTAAVPNNQNGVFVDNASFNTVGPDNVISGNWTNGVKIFGPGSTGNVVTNNTIGGAAGAGAGVWLGNQGYGILLSNLSPKAKNVVAPNVILTNAKGKLFSSRGLTAFRRS